VTTDDRRLAELGYRAWQAAWCENGTPADDRTETVVIRALIATGGRR
jgi:hypothetical protein